MAASQPAMFMVHVYACMSVYACAWVHVWGLHVWDSRDVVKKTDVNNETWFLLHYCHLVVKKSGRRSADSIQYAAADWRVKSTACVCCKKAHGHLLWASSFLTHTDAWYYLWTVVRCGMVLRLGDRTCLGEQNVWDFPGCLERLYRVITFNRIYKHAHINTVIVPTMQFIGWHPLHPLSGLIN